MKKAIMVFFALVWCHLSAATMQSANAEFIKQSPWGYLKTQFIERPRQKVTACFERNANRGLTTLSWLGAAISHLFKPYVEQRHEDAMWEHILVVRNNEVEDPITHQWICKAPEEELNAAAEKNSLWTERNLMLPHVCKAMVFCASLLTIWTIYRNRVALLRRAERECLIELLEDWEQKKQYVPTVVRFHLEQLAKLYVQQPEKVDAQAPAMITFLKQKIRENIDT